MVVGVRRLERDGATRVGIHRTDVDLVPVTGCARAAVVADGERQEVEHQVRVSDRVVAPGEPAALEMVRRAGPAPEEQPLRPDERTAPRLRRGRLHRDRLERPVLDVHLEVVLEMVADTGQVGHDGDLERPKILRSPDTGQLEELGRVDRAARQDDLAGLDPLRPASPPLDLDRHGATAIEHDPGHEGPRPDLQVLPPHHRVEVGPRRGEAATPVDVPVERREPLLAVPVDVVGQVVAGFLTGGEERCEQRVRRRATLQDHRAVMAAKRIVGGRREARLHLLEVRQAVGMVPRLHPGIGRPAFVVERVAALEDHAVDAR